MYLPRNVHDAVPAGLDPKAVARFARTAREGLGIADGRDVPRVFARLGGAYERVPSTFGRHTDRIVVRGAEDFTYEDEAHPDDAAFGLAECLGVRLLHHPLVTKAYGDDAVTAVRRFTVPGDGEKVTQEAIWFAVHLAMPAEAVRAAHADDPTPAGLGRALGVTPRIAGQRARALGLDVPGFAARP